MSDAEKPKSPDRAPVPGEPKRSRLRQILDEQPEARPRLGRAIAAALGTFLVSLTILSALLMWHLARRGRMIRERLKPPREVELPEFPRDEVDPQS
jgi:uncharacterized iron-regulated membrane protein